MLDLVDCSIESIDDVAYFMLNSIVKSKTEFTFRDIIDMMQEGLDFLKKLNDDGFLAYCVKLKKYPGSVKRILGKGKLDTKDPFIASLAAAMLRLYAEFLGGERKLTFIKATRGIIRTYMERAATLKTPAPKTMSEKFDDIFKDAFCGG